jgi:DNA-binding response OmpR family regulator
MVFPALYYLVSPLRDRENEPDGDGYTTMRILIVEDEKSLADILKKGLEEEGYAVDVAYNGEDGQYLAEHETSDLMILDIMLPLVDGMTILKKIRKAGIRTPVLMLTARDAIADKVSGLDSGADDYLTKPFSFEELLARMRVLLRRKPAMITSMIMIKDLVLDTATHEVRRGGKRIPLSAKEYALLEYMALNSNTVLSRTALTEHLYNQDFNLDSNVIDVFINRLRNKIDRGFDDNIILTVRGAGYMVRG